ncbi:MAG: hypothetical protein R2684_01615 [Pyrinomonadaceae bacterium]
MNEAYVVFTDTGREGFLPVGTYLIDAAGRLGVDIECHCNLPESEEANQCIVGIVKGSELLSPPTALEIEQLGIKGRNGEQRLACQSKIVEPGELEVMTEKKNEEAKEKSTAEEFRKEFSEMPLGEKISSLVELEAMAMADTLSYIVGSPYEAVGKVMDVLAGFGRKMEDSDREAKVPEEHSDADTPVDATIVEDQIIEEAEDVKKPKRKTAAGKKKKQEAESHEDE